MEVSYSTKLKEKGDFIKILETHAVEMMEKKEDLFSFSTQPGPVENLSPTSSGWKEVVDKYAEENKKLNASIARPKGKRQSVDGS